MTFHSKGKVDDGYETRNIASHKHVKYCIAPHWEIIMLNLVLLLHYKANAVLNHRYFVHLEGKGKL